MPDVLDYSSHENLPAGLRIETDGAVTRLYCALPRWTSLISALINLSAFAASVGLLTSMVIFYRRLMIPELRGEMWAIFDVQILECVVFLAVGIYQLLWHRKWSRTPRILEVSPEGLTDLRPGFWRLRRRFVARDRINRVETTRGRSVIPGIPDRLTLVVHVDDSWKFREVRLATRNADDARRARDALAKALGLP
jgi:hypothetical protein